MDRFIGSVRFYCGHAFIGLKSNMDRFIDKLLLQEDAAYKKFKIQYG